jgi:tripartite-type tricarboxylate transporter receptor subunit TctC
MRNTLAWLTAILIAAIGGQAMAQAFPAKPVRIIVAFPPGGGTDIVARLVGQRLADLWGQQVIVDARGGGNTVVGTENVAKSLPDGYTLLLTTNAHSVVPHLVKVPFDPINDFVPISMIATTEYVLVVHPVVPANTLQEFTALAKAKPGQLNYASAGSGSANHLAGEQFVSMTSAKIQHIPYKGSGPAVTDLLGGQVQASFQTPIVAIPYIKSGALRALAVSGDTRLVSVPQVPTFTEAGLIGFNPGTWFGIVAPEGTPKLIVDKIANELNRMIAKPEFREKLVGLGLAPSYLPPADFAKLIKTDLMRFGKIIKASDIKLD